MARSLLCFAVLLICNPVSGQTPSSPVEVRLDAEITRGEIWNPWTRTKDAVELRSFNRSLVGPTIRVRPNETLRILLNNRLPACSTEQVQGLECRNETNLHTHGLWVSPAGNSDNVFLSIPPGRNFQYEYLISGDHPAGTFWYHPHRHGSGVYQVSSGMAGALIVDGTRLPTPTGPGDVDILLRDRAGKPFSERVLLLQQVQYACFDASGGPRSTLRDGKRVRPWLCAPDEVGRIEKANQFHRRTLWVDSGRFTSIDGEVQPILKDAVAGRFERWRLVHAGVREIVRVRFRRLSGRAPDLKSVPAEAHEDWIRSYCTGPDLRGWQIALDGLTRSEVRAAAEFVLMPGERVDVLTYFPEAGRYCMLHEGRGPNLPVTHRVLAQVDADKGGATVADPEQELKEQLILAAARSLADPRRSEVRRRVVDDLQQGLRLTAFVWHSPVTDAELTGRQEAVFRTRGVEPDADFLIDEKLYDHSRIDRQLPLGGVEEWRVSVPANGERHQLHIHVNPFQIISIVNGKGEDVIDPASPGYDPDFAGLDGQWRDNILLQPEHRVTLRTRYQRFIGDFVLHCHILLHGDTGMMQNVRISLPSDSVDSHVGH